eukprot:3910153-Prymnesium_polylepis.1
MDCRRRSTPGYISFEGRSPARTLRPHEPSCSRRASGGGVCAARSSADASVALKQGRAPHRVTSQHVGFVPKHFFACSEEHPW